MNAPALAIPPTKPEPLTAAEVNACIKRHFGTAGEQYSVLFEVRNGTAWRANRSVDAVVMGLWPSLGMELWGMEVKVSRHDWKRELANPEKASDVFGYFDRWFLVAPENIVGTGELPEPWGWFVPEGGRLRQMRPATKNTEVKAVDRHFLGALLRQTARHDDAFVQARVEMALAEQRRQHEAEIDRRALERQGDLKKDAEAWIKVRDLIKKKPEDWIYQDDVVAALRVLIKSGVGKSHSSLSELMRITRRLQTELAAVAGDLGIKEDLPKRRRK